jgi:hypothetical protein
MATKQPALSQDAAASDSTYTAPSAKPVKPPKPVLGGTCVVRVADGVVLMNNDTGAYFKTETDTTVKVTRTTLRRIADGDLSLVG